MRKVINNLRAKYEAIEAWAHTPMGDAICVVIIIVVASLVGHWMSWMLWAQGWGL